MCTKSNCRQFITAKSTPKRMTHQAQSKFPRWYRKPVNLTVDQHHSAHFTIFKLIYRLVEKPSSVKNFWNEELKQNKVHLERQEQNLFIAADCAERCWLAPEYFRTLYFLQWKTSKWIFLLHLHREIFNDACILHVRFLWNKKQRPMRNTKVKNLVPRPESWLEHFFGFHPHRMGHIGKK